MLKRIEELVPKQFPYAGNEKTRTQQLAISAHLLRLL